MHWLAWGTAALFAFIGAWLALSGGLKIVLKRDPDGKGLEEFKGGVFGAPLLAIPLLGLGFYLSPSNVAADDVTLEDYKRMGSQARADLLARALPEIAPEALDHLDQYRNCLGYNAPIKRGDLTVMTVLGWCDADRVNAPERFAQHFNDLEAEDYSATVRSHCRDLVKHELVDPATAKFAIFDRGERHLGSWEYSAWGKVDSDNVYGVTFTFRFYCTMKYDGEGAPDALTNWAVSEFTIEQSRS
ncbi:MAG: hypothetical protein IKG52_11320 [Rhodobacteraceae bacterium]|nr:hypothetical protein [Paracoccaceae bacterium]